MKKEKEIKFVFFGTDDFSVSILDELKKADLIPSLIVAAPDRPKGRGLVMTSPETKIWAESRGINVMQPEKLNDSFISNLKAETWNLFIVASYGKIIPQSVLDIPTNGVLNVHPSLLPKWRGASPVEAQILNDDTEVGVTIMLVDDKMDHGPILSQAIVDVPYWPMRGSELQKLSAIEGGRLLAETITDWVDGNIEEQEQDHDTATFSKKIKKEDALLDLKEDAYQNLLKIRAFDIWPRAYFFDEEGKRMIITDAEVKDEKLIIKRVIPEGKKEIDFPLH